MELHDFDKFIRDKVQEVEQAFPKTNREERDRIWKVVNRQLDNSHGYSWIRIAAMIAFLLLPVGVLLLQNTRQKKQIANLRNQIVLLDKESRAFENILSQRQKQESAFVHDTIWLIQPAVLKTRTDTVEVIRYITDTVVVYQRSKLAGTSSADKELSYPAADIGVAASEMELSSPVKSEFILSDTPKDLQSSPGQSRSFSIVFGSGNTGKADYRMNGIKAKL